MIRMVFFDLDFLSFFAILAFLSNSRLSLKTKSWLCFTPVTRTRRTRRTRRTTPHQNLSEGGVLKYSNLTFRLLMGFWLCLGVWMTHVTRRTRRTSPKFTITENTKNLIVAPKFFSDPTFFRTQNFCRTQNVFWMQNFFWPKNFWWPKTFSGPKKYFGLKIFFSG